MSAPRSSSTQSATIVAQQSSPVTSAPEISARRRDMLSRFMPIKRSGGSSITLAENSFEAGSHPREALDRLSRASKYLYKPAFDLPVPDSHKLDRLVSKFGETYNFSFIDRRIRGQQERKARETLRREEYLRWRKKFVDLTLRKAQEYVKCVESEHSIYLAKCNPMSRETPEMVAERAQRHEKESLFLMGELFREYLEATDVEGEDQGHHARETRRQAFRDIIDPPPAPSPSMLPPLQRVSTIQLTPTSLTPQSPIVSHRASMSNVSNRSSHSHAREA